MMQVIIRGERLPFELLDALCATIGADMAVLHGDRAAAAEPSIGQIVADVAFETGLAEARILSPCRERPLFRARAAISYIAKTVTSLKGTEIGAAMGFRDHSTIANQLSAAQVMRAGSDPAFKRLTDRLVARYRERCA